MLPGSKPLHTSPFSLRHVLPDPPPVAVHLCTSPLHVYSVCLPPVCMAACSWVSQVVRGVDDDPVLPRDKVKSINSCKSFEATSDAATIARWLGVLAQELAERCAEDEQEHGRQPRSLGMSRCSTLRCSSSSQQQ
jgi:hypothetical protein